VPEASAGGGVLCEVPVPVQPVSGCESTLRSGTRKGAPMNKPKMLDLFCGAGMASDGYVEAGFDVYGVDVNAQPNYPYSFLQADALQLLDTDYAKQFDVIHASPPCQAHTRAKHLRTAQGGISKYSDLLTPTLAMLRERWDHKVWVVENVPGAPGMETAAVECGSAYGLGVRRHRLFLSNRPLEDSGCRHKQQGRPWGVYHVMGDAIPKGGRTALTLEHGLEVMGVNRTIPWDSLKEGFPPAYTKHVGRQLLEKL
jgi:DNA (cytosine-5)-methyltransferase 1